jgi:TonB family protein
MNRSIEPVSWLISIGIHALIIGLLTQTIMHLPVDSILPTPPIDVTLYAPPQPKQTDTALVGRQGVRPAPEPKSLPGDRDQPETREKTLPVYPKSALNTNLEGTVTVRVTVSDNGRPVAVDIVSSSGHASLDKAFVRAIMDGYRFKPRRVMGKNVVGRIVLTHTFRLGESS